MKSTHTLKLYYFVFFMAIAAFFPFFNLYLNRIGFSGTQIGIITSAGLFMTTMGQPIWGYLSDFFGTRRRILQLNLFICIVLVLIVSLREDFLALIVLWALFRFARSPLMRIIDTITLTCTERGTTYGKVRLWGSLGFAPAVVVVGAILQRTSLKNSFYIFALLAALCLLISFYLPPEIKKKKREKAIRGQLFILIKNQTFLLFLVFSFLVGLSVAMHATFFSIYCAQIGAGEGLIGLFWGIAALSEAVLFFYSDQLLKRFSSVRLLFLGALLYGIRWLLYALISNPYLVLLVQTTQGISHGLFYFSGITFVSQIAPNELQVTGQGIFGAIFAFGLSGIIGSFLGGIIFDSVGVSVMYTIAGVISITAAFLFILGMKLYPNFRS